MGYGAISKQGQVRDRNEDDYLVSIGANNLDIIAVADGMGGHRAGAVASSIAVSTVENHNFRGNKLSSEIRECIKEANSQILQQAKGDSKYKGMGTTLTLGIVKNNILTIGHVGDSRAYLCRQNKLKQITDDHSYVGELVRKNVISSQEAAEHPKRNLLTRALGTEEEVEVDIVEINLEGNDLIFFCSDGVTEMLSKRELETIISKELSLDDKVDLIVERANQAGGYDNITALIYQNS
ncbi:Stp1/IreP family PP2C-type Ser/Thr phosphatase [Halanaerocella petrolearia]